MPDDLLPTLAGKADADVVRAIGLIAQWVRQLRAADREALSALQPLLEQPKSLSIDQIQRALQLNGGNDMNVTGLLGILAQPQNAGAPYVTELPAPQSILNGQLVNLLGVLYYLYAPTDPGSWRAIAAAGVVLEGTHAVRLASFAPAGYALGVLFWETDRTALYRVASVAGVNAWVLMLTRPQLVALASRPADLGTNDAGYLVTLSDVGQIMQRWSGTAWISHQGIQSGTIAARPTTNLDAGFRYVVTDYGYQQFRWSGAAWVLEEGIGGPMRGTIIAADTRPALGANDVGFRFDATDAGIGFRWDGGAWVVVPNTILAGHVVNSGTQSINDATPTTVTFSTTVVDQGPIVSGNTFVVPANSGGASGIWHLLAEITWDGNATGVRTVEIHQNGAAIGSVIVQPNAADVRVQCSAIAFNPAAADIFLVSVQQNSGGALNVEANSSFKAYRMSPNG